MSLEMSEWDFEATPRYSPKEIRDQFVYLWYNVNFEAFVNRVLKDDPNMDDVWQVEKWELFQEAVEGVVRLPLEHLKLMLELKL